ncbi:MAG: Ig-like domain-containing protein [bacterium]
MKSFYRFAFFGILLLASCAKQGYPPGGPVDRTGPVVLEVYPTPGSVNVPHNVKPSLKLSEWIQRNSVENSIFISPEPIDGYRVKVGDKKATIIFNSPLQENRTIVITFGAGISDVNGNQMPASFVLAFATGEQMDSSRVTGYIRNMDTPASTWIWAYPESEFTNPDPRIDRAPFATQPDVSGFFELGFLPRDNYRIFGVVEARRNRLWDVAREAIAFPPEDVQASAVAPPVVSLRMETVDLEPPELRGGEGLHRQGMRLSFTEPVRSDLMEISGQDSLGNRLSIIDITQNPADSNAILLTTGIQREGNVYQLQLNNVQDYAGNRVDSLTIEVTAIPVSDTLGPHLTWTHPAAGAVDVSPETMVKIGFSEPVTMTTLNEAIQVLEGDSIVADGIWLAAGSTIARFKSIESFKGNQTYILNINNALIKDIFGNPSPDSLQQISFSTFNADAAGSLSGQVVDPIPDLKIVAERMSAPAIVKEALVEPDGDYAFEQLLAGYYRLWLYQDSDSDGKLSTGGIDPLRFAESFSISLDSVRVRSRWETEDVQIYWPYPPDWERRVLQKSEGSPETLINN